MALSFDSFQQQNILIVGDVMIDRYLTGKANRISPEAPVPVVHLQGRDSRLGGAGNVALNLKALGATPYLCSVIGQDENARQLAELLPELQLSGKGLIRSAERKTTVKARIIAANQHLLRVDDEDTHGLSEQEAGLLLDGIRDILDNRPIHAILFQDYNKGVLTHKVIHEVMLEAIKRDIPTAVDPKFDNFWTYNHVTLFKPNLKEIQAQLPFRVEPELSSLKKAAEHLHAKLGNQYSLITLSEKGIFFDGNGHSEILATHPRTIADVCGAGDTVFAIAGLGLSLGMPIQDIALLANLAGGQVCEKVGVVPVDKAQLEVEYQMIRKNGTLAH
ncbi:MAG: carbohydrate kinase [Lewinellaceae bacterium]|nr:carbohydrate kinase [Phaeodactylibacter sp.]MCB0615147.1 carbohydrate kinase [Phaeodactylibacter sp.]MCB9351552.1 carbohydrate kinase [Lewinellaceae bacterium]